MRRQESGFTLIELVIVLVILGILAAVAIPRFEDFSTQAKDAAKAGGVSAVASAIAMATVSKKGFPTGDDVASKLGNASCSGGLIKIAGQTTTQFVQVTLVNSSGANLSICDLSTVAGVGTGSFTG